MEIFKQGYYLYKEGKYEEAIECYDKVLKIDPNNVEALTQKGISLGKLGKLDAAISCYDKASKISIESEKQSKEE